MRILSEIRICRNKAILGIFQSDLGQTYSFITKQDYEDFVSQFGFRLGQTYQIQYQGDIGLSKHEINVNRLFVHDKKKSVVSEGKNYFLLDRIQAFFMSGYQYGVV